MRNVAALGLASVVAIVAAAACTIHSNDAPSPTGPSTFATSFVVSATPDTINQDGGSQSSIQILAHDATGKPLSGQTFAVSIQVNNAPDDFGTLSARTIVTGSDGTARVVYTAPAAVAGQVNTATCGTIVTGNLPGQCVAIVAVATGSNLATAQSQSADIRLVPPGVILPPASTPVPSFTVSPTAPSLNVAAIFDGSASCAAALVNSACNAGTATPPQTIAQYAWAFGDGGTASTKTASHTFTSIGTFNVTLTVTNSGGLSASTTQQITVTASSAPTASFVFSPTGPVVSQTVLFNGDNSQAAPGHTIVEFSWNFGDPTSTSNTASGFQATHTFGSAGTYQVVLSVLDDVGQKSTSAQTVAISTGDPAPVITYSPTSPVHNTSVGFTVTVTTSGGATIPSTGYLWNFGDSTSASNSSTLASPAHTFVNPGTYNVQVTVTDSQGRQGTETVSITVS